MRHREIIRLVFVRLVANRNCIALSLFDRHATEVHRLEYDKQACKRRPFHRTTLTFLQACITISIREKYLLTTSCQKYKCA